jgi:hypothetical protein
VWFAMKKKDRILFVLFVILAVFMFCDAALMFYRNEVQAAIKDIVFGIGFGSIGFVYLVSSKENP